MFQILYKSKNNNARVGKIETSKGIIETPAFVFKTYNLQKSLNEETLKNINIQIIKTDAFELWKILSDEGINFSTGIYDILKWQKPIITDSGSLEILKLKENNPKKNIIEILNSGINFFDYQKRLEDYFDSEKSLKIQEELNPNIITAFDLPIEWSENKNIVLEQTEKSHIWQTRFLEAKTSNQQVLAVLGGGIDNDLIELSLRFLNKLSFDGLIINNFLKNPDAEKLIQILKIVNQNYSENKIKYIKNIQSIQELFLFIENGIDMFETELPYKMAKNGFIWSLNQIINLNKNEYNNDNSILDEFCDCLICKQEKTKQEINWQIKNKNPEGFKNLLTHNIYFLNKLTQEIRESIKENKLKELKKYYSQI
ncbi:MAG: tRNA guanosine(34) transglycosylase Tgt [bacterium]|nr:tRNA guanosine(34) transglycosylase Tgt [bacterium]